MNARGVKNQAVADAGGVHLKTVSQWLNDKQVPDEGALRPVAVLLGVPVSWLRYGDEGPAPTVVRESAPTYRAGKLRPAPYARVFEYLEKMRDAHMPEETIEEAERYLVDSNFGQLNKRDYRERSDDEVIMDIDAMWAALKIRFQRDYGVSL